MTVSEITLQGRPWHPSPFISAGVAASRRTTHLVSSFSVLHAPLRAQWMLSCHLPSKGSYFPFELFCVIWCGGSEARWETDCIDCGGHQKTSRPCQSWWSRCELAISMGLTSCSPCQCKHKPLCSFPSHSPALLPHTAAAWRMDVGVCVCVRASWPSIDSGFNINYGRLNESGVWSCVYWITQLLIDPVGSDHTSIDQCSLSTIMAT